ncbi:MAG: aminomethyl-transferring glycine dehydrogenase subunit GcvPB, partial [Methanobacteriota archaeon]
MEPLIFEKSYPGRVGHIVPAPSKELIRELGSEPSIPEPLRREKPPFLPEVSELQVVRHYTRLSQMNFGVDQGFYPLGSCTMKYNPKICEKIAYMDEVTMIHPYQDPKTVQGALEIMYNLSKWLSEIAGVYSTTLQPAAGAHGEFVGMLLIRAYHAYHGQKGRDEIIVPDTAHGTNPASASQAGYRVVVVPSNSRGCVDLDALDAAISERTAGLMLTNPNTLGLFEEEIEEIARRVHDAGGLLYYDGANLNAIMGKTRPGDMGFDIVHFNLHKTFSTPHGGGGPGAGPVGVVKDLDKFLP